MERLLPSSDPASQHGLIVRRGEPKPGWIESIAREKGITDGTMSGMTYEELLIEMGG